MVREADSARISPTAHYTGYVWYRNQLSDAHFRTRMGSVFYHAMRPANGLSRLLGGPTLEAMLLARHRVIDHLLEGAIERGEVTSVIEVAAGLSPRGYRFARKFPHIHYREADLPDMIERKRRVLSDAGGAGANHSTCEVDALADDGPAAISTIAADLDRDGGLAIVTEGLVNYFAPETALGIWRRFAGALSRHPHGLYLSDIQLDDGLEGSVTARAFRRALSVATRGRQVRYYRDDRALSVALEGAGYDPVVVHYAADFDQLGVAGRRDTASVRVIEARTL